MSNSGDRFLKNQKNINNESFKLDTNMDIMNSNQKMKEF